MNIKQLYKRAAVAHQNPAVIIVHFALLFFGLSYFMLPMIGKVTWIHYLGMWCGIIGHYLDRQSTLPLLRLMQTDDWKKYKMKDEFFEANPITGKEPSPMFFELITIPVFIVIVTFCTLIPPFAIAYFSVVVFVARSNTAVHADAKETIEYRKECEAYDHYIAWLWKKPMNSLGILDSDEIS